MIVKNESHIIEKTLINIIKYVKLDYWVICDTGSTDNTIEIIKKFFCELNIPGELYEHKWRDFSYNRNLALQSAFNKADYIFIFDADDEIHGNFKMPILKKNSYNVKFGGGYSYNRISIINNHIKWKYFGVLHEIIKCEEHKNYISETIEGDYYFISGRKGNRNKNPNKYIEDAKTLESAYNSEKNEWLKNRYAFYCGQSYKDSKQYDKALYWYKKTLDLNGWNQEKFYACHMIASIEEIRNNISECINYNLKSLNYDSLRWEGLYWLIKYYWEKGEKNIAYIFVNGIDTSINDYRDYEYKLFLNDAIQNYKLYMLIIIISYKNKNYNKGREALYLLYKNFNKLDISIINIIIYNGQFFIPENNFIINYLDETLDFIKKCIYKFPKETNNETTKCILNNYIKTYTKYIHEKSYIDIRPPLFSNRNIDTILTITSCKRPELFKKTINSILLTWNDLFRVQKIICVDDGTEKKELIKLKKLYPWIEFIEKSENNKGHKSSMQIIRNIVLGSLAKYWINIEDDWLFIKKDDYVKRSINYLQKYENIGVNQILFNKCYGEVIDDIFWEGGKKLEDGLLLHIQNEKKSLCGYWPHFSLRPGITNVNILKKLGDFTTINTFFEFDYAKKYTENNYKTAYFDEITCIHIGKLVGIRGNISEKNSYELNNVIQGSKANLYDIKDNFVIESNIYKSHTLPIKVINLKRRKDRRNKMEAILNNINFQFKDGIDGINLQNDDPRLYAFEGNDFNNNAGTIGCAISHIELWKQLLEDNSTEYYIIMEDDINLRKNWFNSLSGIENELVNNHIVLLGYSMFSNIRQQHYKKYNNNEEVKIYDLSLDNFVGGFFCYSINKKGAEKILLYLNKNGIKHGIDYLVMKKIPLLQKKECRPQIAFTEWKEGNKYVDTDIQNFDKSIEIKKYTNESICDNSNNITYEKIIELSHNTFIYYSEYDILDIDNDYNNISDNLNSDWVAYNSIGHYKKSLGSILEKSKIFNRQQGIYIKNNISINNSISKHNINENKIVIITPCYRIENLKQIYNSINFNFVIKWIIIYDGKYILNYPKQFENNDNIEEYNYAADESMWGNAQRNYALDILAKKKALHNCFVYFLDDDNIIHPNLYKILNYISKNNIYTFDQKRLSNIDGTYGLTLTGNNIDYQKIDTAQILLYYSLIKDIRWDISIYQADYYYIKECCVKNYKVHKYIPLEASYWNYLRKS
tara:strand:- start:4893 stop:8519 length:3627 start_codon:yes stop_codon:yes gene_type:complete